MEENTNNLPQLEQAKKRLERIKNFYRHVIVYIVINIIVFGVIVSLYDLFGWQEIDNPDFQFWFMLNLISTPLLWGLGVLVHGLVVFNPMKFNKKGLTPKFIKKWEEKQIQKYLNNNS